MTTMELNARFASQIELVKADEDLLGKVVKAIDRLIKKQQKEEETEYISKEEILAGIDAGLKDVKAGRTRPAHELLEELKHGL